MKVYRVEHKYDVSQHYPNVIVRVGPYLNRVYECSEYLRFAHSTGNNHPGPRDSGYVCMPGFYFGFESLDKLNNWFDDELEVNEVGHTARDVLVEDDFHIAIYEIEKRYVDYVDRFQITFDAEHATSVEYMDIT